MTIKDKNEELKFIVSRYDHFYDSINNKGNLYLTINTFILAGTITGFYALDQDFHFGDGVLFLVFIPVLASNLVSLLLTLLAIKPFARRVKRGQSVMFFGDVSRRTRATWKAQWDNLREDIFHTELLDQSHQLSIGLTTKFKRLGWATLFIGLQVAGIVFFSIYLLTL